MSREGGGAEVAGLVEDRAGEEEASGVVALSGGDGAIRGPRAGFSGGALGGSGGDFLEWGIVEEVNSPNQGLEGREGKGDFLFEVSGDPLRGEEDGTGEDRATERGKDLLSLEGDLVSNHSVLNGEGPRNNVVEPPAAAFEIVLEVVSAPKRMGIETGRARRRKDSVWEGREAAKPGEMGVIST